MTTRQQDAANLAAGIGSLIADVKRRRGLSGIELAERAGVTSSQISRWEHAKVDISVADLIAVCAALDIAFDDFMAEAKRRAAAIDFTARADSSTTPE